MACFRYVVFVSVLLATAGQAAPFQNPAPTPATAPATPAEVLHWNRLEAAVSEIEAAYDRHDIQKNSAEVADKAIAVFLASPKMDQPDRAKATDEVKAFEADEAKKIAALEKLDKVLVADLATMKAALVEIQREYAGTAIGKKASVLVIKAGAARLVKDPVLSKELPSRDAVTGMRVALKDIKDSRAGCPSVERVNRWRTQLATERDTLEKELATKTPEMQRLDRRIPELDRQVKLQTASQERAVAKLRALANREQALAAKINLALREIFPVVVQQDKGEKDEQQRPKLVKVPLQARSDDPVQRRLAEIIDARYTIATLRVLSNTSAASLGSAFAAFPTKDTMWGTFDPKDEESFDWVSVTGAPKVASLFDMKVPQTESVTVGSGAEMRIHTFQLAVPKIATGRLGEIDELEKQAVEAGIAAAYQAKTAIEATLTASTAEWKKERVARDAIAHSLELPLSETKRLLAQVDVCDDKRALADEALLGAGDKRPVAKELTDAAKKAKEAKAQADKVADELRKRNLNK